MHAIKLQPMLSKNTTLIIIVCALSLYSCKKEQGCTDITSCNFSTTAEEDDGSCFSPGDECDDGSSNTMNDTYDNNCNCEGSSVLTGCMDSVACNFNESATINDGSSCIYIGDSCDDNNPSTMDDQYNTECSCEGTITDVGCMESSACNYNPSANTEDNSCVYPGDDCNDFDSSTTNDTYDSNCNCIGTASNNGCTDSSACNYDQNANTEDNSCTYPGDSCNDFDSSTSNDTYDSNCICIGTTSNNGCTDSSACNYDQNANTEDNSCVYPGDSCDDNNANTINDTINSNCDCQGTTSESGCMDSSACNYNTNANTDDNSCVYPGDSCDDNNSNTINDTINANCDCVGESTNGESCVIDGSGQVNLEIGIYTDTWPVENTVVLLNSSGNQLFTPQTPATANAYNSWTFNYISNGDQVTILVTDAYGDGLVDGGYFVTRCLSTSGQVINLIPETTWDTGNPKTPNTPISISVDFTIP